MNLATDQYTPNTSPRGNSSGELSAQEALLRREFAALRRIDDVLRQAIYEEEALGLEVCTGAFCDCLDMLSLLGLDIARELARVTQAMGSNLPKGAGASVAH